jgi:ribosomal protein L30
MLFVTLRRGLAGKQKTFLAVLKSLGLKRPNHEVGVPNNRGIRGQIEKVSSSPIEGVGA